MPLAAAANRISEGPRAPRADLSRMRAPITAKQRCRSSGNWAAWALAAMRFTRVALVIYGLRRSRPQPWCPSDGPTSRTPSASRYFSPRMSSGLSSSPTDRDLERVLSAIGASVSGTPANPGMGTRFVAAQATAECTTARTFGKAKACTVAIRYTAASGSTAPRPFINDTLRTRRGLINGQYEPLTTGARAPPAVASICLSTRLSPSMCRFLRMSRLHPRASAPATPLPHPTTLVPQHLQRASAHPPWAPATYNTPSKRSKRAQNTHTAYNELVVSAMPHTSRPHPPPRSRPRPTPGHHDLATQALATRRGRPISTSIRFFGDCFLHTSALNARPAHLPAPSQRGLDAHPVLAQRPHLLPPFCAVVSFTMLPPRSAATPRDTAP
ncbi:hypothetical protein B0H14DRAFT_3868144 [Mycena olivaceomarginata]|nr:hypothetical protein B0H14DRAFT_3868144 [Mycena olivaceomarginata]